MGRKERRAFETYEKKARLHSVYGTAAKNMWNKLKNNISAMTDEEVRQLYHIDYEENDINLIEYFPYVLPSSSCNIKAIIHNFCVRCAKMLHGEEYDDVKDIDKKIEEIFGTTEEILPFIKNDDSTLVMMKYPLPRYSESYDTEAEFFITAYIRKFPKEAIYDIWEAVIQHYMENCTDGSYSAPTYSTIKSPVTNESLDRTAAPVAPDAPLIVVFFDYLLIKWAFSILDKMHLSLPGFPKPSNRLNEILNDNMPKDCFYYKYFISKEILVRDKLLEDSIIDERKQEYKYFNYTVTQYFYNVKIDDLTKEQKEQFDKVIDAQVDYDFDHMWNIYFATRNTPDHSTIHSAGHYISELYRQIEAHHGKESDKKVESLEKELEKTKEKQLSTGQVIPIAKYNGLELECNQKIAKYEKELSEVKASEQKKVSEYTVKLQEQEKQIKDLKKEQYTLQNDQYADVREAALLRKENEKLKRQLKIRDSLNITPEQNDMLTEIEELCENVPFDEKLDFLKGKSVGLFGGDKTDLERKLKDYGFERVDTYHYVPNKITAKYDIYVCLIQRMSHPLMWMAQSAAKKTDGIIVYFDYANSERLIDEMYEAYLNTLDE